MDTCERLALLSNDLRTLFSTNDPVYLRIHAVCADAKAEIESLRKIHAMHEEVIQSCKAEISKLRATIVGGGRGQEAPEAGAVEPSA